MILDLLLTNANTLIPDINSPFGHRIEALDVGVTNGKIVEIASSIRRPAKKVLSLSGLHLLPGVIDSQVHFREPGFPNKEDLESGTRGALLGGVTSVFEMPNTSPSTTTPELFQDKLNRAKQRCHTHYAFYIGGCAENADQLGELEKMPHCCGIKVFMGSSTGSLLVEDDLTLEKILRSGKRRVIVHSEDESRLQERKSIALKSKNVADHPVWRDVETAVRSTQRLLSLARKTGRNVHVLHVTSAEEIELLKEQKDIASIEVLPQHLTLFAPECYERLGTYAQQNPPIREKRHHDRLWQAVKDGTVDVLGSDHAPHTREEKDRDYPTSPSGMPGVQTLVPLMLNHVNEGRLSLERFVQLTSDNQRKVFGIKNKGRIEVGYDADFTVVDLKKEKTITNSWMASRCGWTPFDGMKVKGWPTMTILKGQIAMQDDQILLPSSGDPIDFEI
ncbi:MAG: dihydroorotase [Bdellovibrionota bacterium]